jgi:hypothetical protein
VILKTAATPQLTRAACIQLKWVVAEIAHVLQDIPQDSLYVSIPGDVLWKRLLDIVVTGQCEVAIDPMEAHGIRLTREMILSMVSKYSEGQ